MKIFTTEQLREIDRFTIESEPIASIDLMERAASAVAYEIMTRWLPNKRIVVFAGPGNNGGDALAVARMLIEQGYKLEVFLLNIIKNHDISSDCAINKEKLLTLPDVDFTEVTNFFTPPPLSKDDVVIDGLFGSGLKAPLTGGLKSLVRYINESRAYIVSIDVPSGLFGEWNLENDRQTIITANLTLAFQLPRLSFFFGENSEFIGEWKALDLELSDEAITKTPTDYYVVEKNDVKRVLKKRKPFSSKRDYGSALIVSGSYGMLGASILSSKAALRAGAGLVTVHAPRCAYSIVQTSVPEALFSPDSHDIIITDITLEHAFDSVAIGPGIGTNKYTIDALEKYLINAKKPCVLDADALNCIAERPSLLNSIPQMSIITPHSREFDRLFGEQLSGEQRLRTAIEKAAYYHIIIILKSHFTMIVRPDGKVYINNTGNAGMATAGSGDVLLGVIASLMAQGYKPEVSAVIGVYIHGHAGDMALNEQGSYGLIASDIINNLGPAINEIMESN